MFEKEKLNLNTREIEEFVRTQLSQEYGVPLMERKVSLYGTDEQKKFDAVSEDLSIIIEITSIGCKNLKRKYIPQSRLSLRVLLLSSARRAHPDSEVVLVLTNPATYEMWKDSPPAIEAELLGVKTWFIPVPDS